MPRIRKLTKTVYLSEGAIERLRRLADHHYTKTSQMIEKLVDQAYVADIGPIDTSPPAGPESGPEK